MKICITNVFAYVCMLHYLCTYGMNNVSPIQFLLFAIKAYPVLQEQIKLPIVLLQSCSHPSISRLHSSISVTSKCAYYNVEVIG